MFFADLILKLCTDHTRRLGKNGAQEIKVRCLVHQLLSVSMEINKTVLSIEPRFPVPDIPPERSASTSPRL